MTAPLYFLPRLKREHVTPAILQARGLGDLLRDELDPSGHTGRDVLQHVPMFELTAPGPDGLPGTILSINAPGALAPPRFGYYPQSNDWHKISDDLYLGLDRHDPPQPRDLQRPSRRTDAAGKPLPPHPGHLVTCADGRTWEVPVVRRPNDTTELPRYMGWDAAGNFSLRIDPAYQAVWDMTAEVVTIFFESAMSQISYERAAELSLAALALNYRVTRPLVSHARLLATSDWEAILGALVDLPTYKAIAHQEAARNKGRPATASANSSDPTPADNCAHDCPPALPPTVAGPPDDCRNTAQAAPS